MLGGCGCRIRLLHSASDVRRQIADYDANWFRQALAARGITACIPSKSYRAKPIEHDRMLYGQRHKVENTFGRLKDWRESNPLRQIAHTFMGHHAGHSPSRSKA